MHSMVTVATVSWEHAKSQESHPVVFPPLQLDATNADQIGAGILINLQRHLLNDLEFEIWLETIASKYSRVKLFIVADSASANVKLTWRFMSYVQNLCKRLKILATCNFNPCLLHQIARMVAPCWMTCVQSLVSFVHGVCLFPKEEN